MQTDVHLSNEHTEYAWMSVEAYSERYCREDVAALAPPWAREFLAQMRFNCESMIEWLETRRRA
jgi:hypothetical protein